METTFRFHYNYQSHVFVYDNYEQVGRATEFTLKNELLDSILSNF